MVADGAVMLSSLVDDPLAIARPLSWIVVVLFLGTGLLSSKDRERARGTGVAAWGLFAVFWLVLTPHFVFEQKSIVEGVGSIAAVPLSLYVAYLLWNGRDSLFTLTKAVGFMGLIYLPFAYIPLVETNPARKWIIETVASQTSVLLSMIGVEPSLGQYTDVPSFNQAPSQDHTFQSTFYFAETDIAYTIIVACTGLGSIAILAGAILAVQAPMRRKLRALVLSASIIYVLNLGRNVFIATMFGEQRMQWFVGPITTLFGTTDEKMVSYYIADRMLAQFGSVVALIAITWLIVRELPEILGLIEECAYVVTGNEYDLASAFSVDPVRADGGDGERE